jgi:hypothetical protein
VGGRPRGLWGGDPTCGKLDAAAAGRGVARGDNAGAWRAGAPRSDPGALSVDRAASGGYIRNNQGRMDDPRYRAAGYPIGSGTVESAANTVVQHRMKRPGRGWKRSNAEAMLAGLSELHCNRFLDS